MVGSAEYGAYRASRAHQGRAGRAAYPATNDYGQARSLEHGAQATIRGPVYPAHLESAGEEAAANARHSAAWGATCRVEAPPGGRRWECREDRAGEPVQWHGGVDGAHEKNGQRTAAGTTGQQPAKPRKPQRAGHTKAAAKTVEHRSAAEHAEGPADSKSRIGEGAAKIPRSNAGIWRRGWPARTSTPCAKVLSGSKRLERQKSRGGSRKQFFTDCEFYQRLQTFKTSPAMLSR